MTNEIKLDLTDDLRAIRQAAADYRANAVRPEFMAEVEFRIIGGIVRRALAAGYAVSINDDAAGGGEWVVKSSRDLDEIMGALCTTGGDLMVLRDADGKKAGWIQLVYNGDDTVVADHSENLPAGILDAAVRS